MRLGMVADDVPLRQDVTRQAGIGLYLLAFLEEGRAHAVPLQDGQNARLAAKLSGWRVDVIKPVEGEVYEEISNNGREVAAPHSTRRERGERSQHNHGRYERGERGEGGSRRRSGGNRHNTSYTYDEE